jgi:hypothetical protein
MIFHVMKGIFKRHPESAAVPRLFALPLKVADSRARRVLSRECASGPPFQAAGCENDSVRALADERRRAFWPH